MDVLITGADTDLGRVIADGFHRAGHRVIVAGSDAGAVDTLARDLQTDAVVCDPADPASLAHAQAGFPHHLDAVVIVPTPAWIDGDPRTFTLADTSVVWRSAFDRIVVSAVLTVQSIGEHLRSGGSIVSVVPASAESGPEAAAKAALSTWTAAQADHFGARGITINTVACGRTVQPGYNGLADEPLSAAAEIARMTTFLATPAARHITGQTLHVGRGAALTYS